MENRLGDLWAIMEFLNPGFLGSSADFRRRFAIPIERYQDFQRSSQLKSLVQPFMLRRLKTDKSIIQDLPEKQEMKVFCNLTREQATLYEAVLQDMMQQIEQAEGMERRGLVLAALMKLKQVCNHPAQFLRDGSSLEGRSGKLERLVGMLEEVVAAGDRALIFTQYSEMGERLKSHLESVFHRETLFLHGGIRRKVREQIELGVLPAIQAMVRACLAESTDPGFNGRGFDYGDLPLGGRFIFQSSFLSGIH